MKHISLDFWNTIADPNPDYADKRTSYLANRYNVEYETARDIYTHQKLHIDGMCELNGSANSVLQSHIALCRRIDTSPKFGDIEDAEYNMQRMNELFHQYPPHIPRKTIKAIYRAQDNGVTVSISSNTNFISGVELHKYMNSVGIWPDFALYSDIIGYSKPHENFFKQVIFNAQVKHKFDITTDKILHIGDHHVCDKSAEKYGIPVHILSNPSKLANVILNYI